MNIGNKSFCIPSNFLQLFVYTQFYDFSQELRRNSDDHLRYEISECYLFFAASFRTRFLHGIVFSVLSSSVWSLAVSTPAAAGLDLRATSAGALQGPG